MKVPRDLQLKEKCQFCDLRSEDFFCKLPPDDLQRFEAIKVTRSYEKGSILFLEGQPCSGVYMLCHGRIKLSTGSQTGKIIILEIAGPGDIVGLSSAFNATDHDCTAEVLEPCQVNYIQTADLIRFVRRNPEAGLRAIRQLSRNYQTAYRQICSLGLSDSVFDKLAKLFLAWSSNGAANGQVRLKNLFTHEEMAEMIGSSRETVTRALRCFREHGLVTLKGPDLVIHDTRRLRSVIGSRGWVRADIEM